MGTTLKRVLTAQNHAFYNIYMGVSLQQEIKKELNTLPNNKILDLSKLKIFADDKINFAKMMIYVYDRAENIVGKG